MNIWGKVIGAIIGFLAGKFPGLLLGLWLGHLVDQRGSNNLFGNANRSELFFMSTFAVMGHVAKSTGRITEHDIALASNLMDQLGLTGEKRKMAQAAFVDGKTPGFNLLSVLNDLRRLSMGRSGVLQMFLEIQIQTALADGRLDPEERELLELMARTLGFSNSHLSQLINRWQAEFRNQQQGQNRSQQQQLQDAYRVLGVNQGVSKSELKKVYRRLMSEHHPDKLVAKGLPPEMMDIAKQKAQEIQSAYELVKNQVN
ncbi:co-chaperone DjlA [Paraferrimonas haliotis]|uniref:Co-chaperone protein DjlA n=1 Tax=Paraferrimonas haliotis TaxID=2013866 RepID=A0AA37TT55_9GAMM|nr:co-chaperone DjlA [Paraferrimonas haliotis]GLS82390.1 co-chaperone protein DjlA [Paraferrimonas haliotis]